jgi:predicted XRE-type DNA-binding protein
LFCTYVEVGKLGGWNDVEQLKGILAAKIIGILDDRGLSVRKAEDHTGVKASEFSRIRNAHLERFTVDRLMSIINRLHCRIDVKVSVKLMPPAASQTAHRAPAP